MNEPDVVVAEGANATDGRVVTFLELIDGFTCEIAVLLLGTAWLSGYHTFLLRNYR